MPQVEQVRAYDELRRNWRVLPPCLAGVTLCAVHGYSIGVMIPELEREFGWLRSEISGGLMIIAMIALVGAPLAGSFIDRFGPRRIGLFGILFFCSSIALLATTGSSLASWWGLWILLGVANMFVLPTLWTSVINARFDRNRGTALALALCGTGIAAALVPSLTRWLIELFGWRGAFIGLGVIGAVITFPLAWLMFDRRGGATHEHTAAEAKRAASGVSARQGFRTPAFIKLAIAILLFGLICALTTNAYPILLSRGLTPGQAAALAGMIGIGSIIGRLGGGLLLDRFEARKVAALSVTMPILAVLLLLYAPAGSTLWGGLACLLIGLSVGTEVDCAAYLAARHFGLRSFGTLFGALNGLMLFGNGFAPVVSNYVFDVTRSYEIVLWAEIPICLATAAMFLWLGAYPNPASDEDGAAGLDGNPAPAMPAPAAG